MADAAEGVAVLVADAVGPGADCGAAEASKLGSPEGFTPAEGLPAAPFELVVCVAPDSVPPPAGFAFGTFDCGSFAEPGSGVVPFTIFCAENSGATSVSFFTRMEILRLEGSVGLFFTRSIWSA